MQSYQGPINQKQQYTPKDLILDDQTLSRSDTGLIMHRFHVFYCVLLATCLFLSQPNAANAQFGAGVAVHEGSVFVMKPGGAFGGIASISQFSEANEEWIVAHRIYAAGGTDSGQAMSPVLVSYQDQLFAGAGDPQANNGAHVFSQTGTGWENDTQVMLTELVARSAPDATNLADIMRVIQPPLRTLAVSHSVLVIGVPDVGSSTSGVHLFEKMGTTWKRTATLTPPDGGNASQFGKGLAITNQFAFIGAPRADSAGTVYVYHKQQNGNWASRAVLSGMNLAATANFGAAILADANRLIIGAPGGSGVAGSVHVFKMQSDTEQWVEIQRISSPQPAPSDAFGTTLAMINDELWIGAPGTNQSEGVVYRFSFDAPKAAWSLENPLQLEGLEARSLFGTAIAGDGNTAVVGAPGADAGAGMAAIFTKDDQNDWHAAAWIRQDEALPLVTGDEVRCEDGQAAGFACDNVDLLAYLPISALGAMSREQVSDLWGWTDPQTGHEYALVGRTSGASIVDVTIPSQPVYVGLVPANPTPTRDLKVYRDHLYFTGDGAGDHGLVVFDLTRLRSRNQPDAPISPMVFKADTVYHGIASAHNLIMDAESGFAYAVGASRGGESCGGGLHMIDIRQPKKPTFAGCYTDTVGLFSEGRTHDGQCTVYRGPDERYFEQQICFVSNETALRIVDVTDKANPKPLAAARYPRTAYVHQGWLTDDHRYFYLDDELDELVGMTNRTRTLIWDVSELDDPVLVGEFGGETPATDHNLYVKGDRMYQANYQAGMSVWDISNPVKPVQIGSFDTTPAAGNPPGFVGAWTAYPYFESGTVIVSSMQEGLFIVRPREAKITP